MKELLFYVAGAAQRKRLLFLRAAATAAIPIGIAHMRHPRDQRRETPLLLRLRAGQRKRAYRPSVECAEEGDHLLPLGMIAGNLQRALDCLGARVPVVEAVRAG